MTEVTAAPAGIGSQGVDDLDGACQPAVGSTATVGELVRRWSVLPGVALERLPLPYPLTIVLLAALALGEQVLEYSIEQAASGGATPMSPLRLAVFPILVIYILGHLYVLKRSKVNALAELRPCVLVTDEAFDEHVRHIVSASTRVELVLFVVSLAVVLVGLLGLRSDLLNTNSSLPASWPAATYIVVMYVVLGWVLLSEVYASIRNGRALRALAKRPLAINVFDPAGLVPLGTLGLIQSLPIIGVVLVPLVLFGAPTGAGYLLIFLSAISFLALFLPLWGVHQQIDQAQERALAVIYGQLQEVYDVLRQGVAVDVPNLAALNHRTSMLVHLRNTVNDAPNWPFKDSAAFARALVAVASPLIYFILNELIRTYLLPILSGSPAS